jgi:ankyrin repeat protein
MIRSSLLSLCAALLFALGMTPAFAADLYDSAVAATIDNKPNQLKLALDKGLDPNTATPSGTGDPLLMLAIRNNADQVVDTLLERKNINVNRKNALQETPLMIAVYLNKNEVAKKLLEKGAAVNNPGHWSPLHYAANVGNNEMVKELIRRGADVNARTLRGQTPLYMAARDAGIETVKILLNAGARKDFCTNEALAPADIAKQRGNSREVIDALAYDHCR